MLIGLLVKVGTQSGGKDAVEYPVGQDARQEGEHCGVAADGVASARLARRHCLGITLAAASAGRPDSVNDAACAVMACTSAP